MPTPTGLFRALLDAMHYEDDLIAGRPLTYLTANLSETELVTMEVESTLQFGEYTDGTGTAMLLIDGEIIFAAARTVVEPFQFTGLIRGLNRTTVKAHPAGTPVFDLSRNSSALDRVARGIFVEFAVAEDLRVIARNHGMEACPGLDDETLRRVLKVVPYLPKQPLDAFRRALEAYFGNTTSFTVTERTISDPWKVFVEVTTPPLDSLHGQLVLNGGEETVTTGVTTVVTAYPVLGVLGVFLVTPATRNGFREGATNYFTGGSFLGSTITLGSSPGPPGTPVIVDYSAFTAHYAAANAVPNPNDVWADDVRDDEDFWGYLADPLLSLRCLLDHVRAAGIRVELSSRL